ncbi:MAG: peptide ABC transporter substrate-binding protein [Firmicutes bacterium]|nr:peptide ABC transporter substrate-binding protein [Bacillota bacterium]
MKRTGVLFLAMIMMISCVFTGCGQKEANTGDTQASSEVKSEESVKDDVEQIINVEFNEDMSSLNSAKMAESYANTVIMETQEMLVRMENGTLQPAGAKSWSQSEDGLVWTFKIRDFKWSDDVAVKAEDYAFAVEAMLDPSTACPNAGMFYFIKGAKAFNTGEGDFQGVGVKAIDDKTLEFTLDYQVPYFLQLMNFANLVPLREDIYSAQAGTYGQDETTMVYSGPFYVEKWVKGSKIILAKNESYWDKDKVKLDKAIINIVKEEPTKMKMFNSKAIDIVTSVKGEYNTALEKMANDGEIIALSGYQPRSAEVIFNTQDESGFFKNDKIRLAFSLAIDREAYVNTIAKGKVAAYGWVPYEILLDDVKYREATEGPLKTAMDKDPKALYEEGLAELGLDPAKEHEVTFLIKSASTSERSNGEFYQDQWEKKLGVKVNIDVASDNATFNKCVMEGQYQVCQSGWGADFNDPVNFLEMFETGNGNNGPFFSDEKFDELIALSRTEQDTQKRLELFQEAEKILVAEKAAIAPVTFEKKSSYVQNYVKGVELPSFGPKFEFKNASIEGK